MLLFCVCFFGLSSFFPFGRNHSWSIFLSCSESIPTASARVEALRSHGYRKEALRLAVAVVRTMKRQQRDWQHRWQSEQNKGSGSASSCTSSGISSNPLHNNMEGWIGNPLDPISSLFDTLAEASLSSDSKPLEAYYGFSLSNDSSSTSNSNSNANSNASNTNNAIPPTQPVGLNNAAALALEDSGPTSQQSAVQSSSREKPKYQHVVLPGSRDRNESYLCLAIEAALISLGQQRLMPLGFYAQEKSCKQEDRLITKLHDIELDTFMVAVLRKQVMCLLEGGPFSGLGCGIHADSVPMHTFAKYLFNALLAHDPDLAYSIGLRAMR